MDALSKRLSTSAETVFDTLENLYETNKKRNAVYPPKLQPRPQLP